MAEPRHTAAGSRFLPVSSLFEKLSYVIVRIFEIIVYLGVSYGVLSYIVPGPKLSYNTIIIVRSGNSAGMDEGERERVRCAPATERKHNAGV